jgi:uncharacterized protein (TIGR02996 family)
VTEDEAFLRAIVDSPGDDTPRLVYADWLDERDDPRGPYLRAEADALRQFRDTADFRPLMMWHATYPSLAATLDPLWVARVSRPPIGVCVEHVGFEKRRPPTTPEALGVIERRFNLRLPVDYQAFLLNYNALWSDSAYHRVPSGYHYPLLYIFAVNNRDGTPYDGPGDGLASTWQLQQLDLSWRLQQIERGDSWPEWDSPHIQDFVPILCDDEEPDGESGWILLGVRGEQLGRVATLGYDPQENVDTTVPVADSFALFLSSLVPTNSAEPRLSTRRRLFES